jgi:hypothetical protein
VEARRRARANESAVKKVCFEESELSRKDGKVQSLGDRDRGTGDRIPRPQARPLEVPQAPERGNLLAQRAPPLRSLCPLREMVFD